MSSTYTCSRAIVYANGLKIIVYDIVNVTVL